MLHVMHKLAVSHVLCFNMNSAQVLLKSELALKQMATLTSDPVPEERSIMRKT